MNIYTAQHKKRITSKQDLLDSEIKAGHIITFRYDSSKSNKDPIILVLNPDEDGMLHGLVLDYMSVTQVNSFKKYIINEMKEENPKSILGMQGSINVLTSGNHQTFYKFKLKDYLDRNFKQSVYRTYNVKKAKNTKILTYKF